MGSISCVSSSFTLPKKLSITNKCSSPRSLSSPATASSSLSFSTHISPTAFSSGCLAMRVSGRPIRGWSVVCDATAPTKKADSAAKRARQNEKRRIYNKSKKSEFKTRMKKVLESLDALQKKSDAQSEEILTIEKLIAEAYSAIDKAVKAGALHRNTGANRKSRLARRKKTVEIHHGWYTPATSLTV